MFVVEVEIAEVNFVCGFAGCAVVVFVAGVVLADCAGAVVGRFDVLGRVAYGLLCLAFVLAVAWAEG